MIVDFGQGWFVADFGRRVRAAVILRLVVVGGGVRVSLTAPYIAIIALIDKIAAISIISAVVALVSPIARPLSAVRIPGRNARLIRAILGPHRAEGFPRAATASLVNPVPARNRPIRRRLALFANYSLHYVGKFNSFDWAVLWANEIAWLLQPALFLHFVLTFPEQREFVTRHRWSIPTLYLPGVALLGIQALACAVCGTYAVIVTFVLLVGINKLVDRLRKDNFEVRGLSFGVAPAKDKSKDIDYLGSVSGDKKFLSSDPKSRAAKPHISEMTMEFP